METILLPHGLPPMTSWTWHANLLSILSMYPQSYDWIYSNYINLFFTTRDGQRERAFLDFWPQYHVTVQCPFISFQIISRDTIIKYAQGNIIGFFKHMIHSKNYIYGIFNEFFLGKNYFPHELCIYGYDDTQSAFLVGDFTFNKKFSFRYILFDIIEKAFTSLNDCDDFILEGKGGVQFLSYYPQAEYLLDTQYIRRAISRYLASENISDDYNTMSNSKLYGCWGISAYDGIANSINKLGLDIRALSNLRDHKLMLTKRSEYMRNKGVLAGEYDVSRFGKLYELAQIALNIGIKSRISEADKKDKVLGILQNMKMIEIEELSVFADAIIDTPKVGQKYWYDGFSNSSFLGVQQSE